MTVPIADFLKKYSESEFSRLHMPGHKGKDITGYEQFDITEIKGADSLFEADGIIAESERNAAALFGSEKTLYSTEGSSLCIKTMLALVKLKANNGKCVVLASRNCHKSFVYGCALLDIDVEWLYGENDDFSLCRCDVTPSELEKKLRENKKISAVYVTSPDYLGGETDIAALSRITRKYLVPLLVDNAHGAYLRFLPESRHPMDLGADMCCDSAHKTLPVLTGGAYLHISSDAPKEFRENARRCMEMFASTSPSYLILRSLDEANGYLSDGYKEKLDKCVKSVGRLKEIIAENGGKIIKSDPLKITVVSGGVNLSELLRKSFIECEYEDPDYTVMMFTPENGRRDFERLEKFFYGGFISKDIPRLRFEPPKKAMSVREAVFNPCEFTPVSKAPGKIAASPAVSCPPAVPVVVSGEIINESAAAVFEHYGIKKILTVK